MPKQLRLSHVGKLKVYQLEGDSIGYEAISSFIDGDGKFLLSSLFFGGNPELKTMGGKKLNLIPNNQNEPVTSEILFPRLKKLDDTYFIFSGLYKEDDINHILIGRFKGSIPENYPQYQDEMVYPEDYWELN